MTTKGNALDPGRILVKRSPIGYVCIGIGESARLLRLASLDDRALQKAAGIPVPQSSGGDPYLRRLAFLASLAKEYDDDEPRDEDGRWTSGGAAGSSGSGDTGANAGKDGATAIATPAAPAVRFPFASLSPEALAGLAQLGRTVTIGGGVGIVLGILFFPTNNGGVSEGTIPDYPDVIWKFDMAAGTFALFKKGENGQRTLYSGHYDINGVFRDANGNAVARTVDGSIIVDPDVFPALAAVLAVRQQIETRTQPQAIAANDNLPNFALILDQTFLTGRKRRPTPTRPTSRAFPQDWP